VTQYGGSTARVLARRRPPDRAEPGRPRSGRRPSGVQRQILSRRRGAGAGDGDHSFRTIQRGLALNDGGRSQRARRGGANSPVVCQPTARSSGHTSERQTSLWSSRGLVERSRSVTHPAASIRLGACSGSTGRGVCQSSLGGDGSGGPRGGIGSSHTYSAAALLCSCVDGSTLALRPPHVALSQGARALPRQRRGECERLSYPTARASTRCGQDAHPAR
jgi:hypothetical protein